jgi:S1-C subfamily serine protease
MVLTADGEILTNNHVVAGATGITVTIVSSGDRYQASVVGVDPTDDVAVLQLSGASDLATANLSSSANLAVGDAVTGVGNAGGAGGVPSASPGQVTALNQTITTQAEGSAAAETLHGLIETNADIQAGDSGGPLYDANDQIVGIDTAAEEGGYTTAGYAIPIASALSIAQQIENGQASENVVIGNPAFLGVQVSSTTGGRYRYSQAATSGALISGVVTGTPAAAAGLVAGDIITGVDGTSITAPSDLTSALAGHTPGQQITVTWVDGSGASQSAAVTLAAGPAL